MNEFSYLINLFINCLLILLNLFFTINGVSSISKFQKNPIAISLLYILLQASIVTFLSSINASLAKYFMYCIAIFNVMISCYFSYKKTNQFFFKKATYKIIATSLICLCIIFIYTFISFKYKFIFNGHDPYFYGVPFEILNADYTGRLRVFDNYPFEWTKFHFFNGAISSVLLLPVFNFNIFLFKFSKLILLNLAILSIVEYYKTNSKHLILIIILLLLNSSQFVWIFYTNGFISLFLFAFVLLLLNKGSEDQSEYLFLIFSLILLFSLSTIRSLIPGISLIIFFFIKYFYNLKSFTNKNIFIFLILIISIVSMVISGESSDKHPALLFSFKNYFSWGWNDLFFIRSSIISLKEFVLYYIESSLIVFVIWVLSVVLFFWKNFKVLISLINPLKFSLRFYIFIYFFINLMSVIFYGNKILFALSSILIFISPIFLIFKKNIFSHDARYFLIIYIIFSIIQVSFVSPSQSIPNLYHLDYLILFIFLIYIFKNKLLNYLFLLPFILFPFFSFQFMLFPRKNDRTTHSVDLREHFNKKKQKNSIDLKDLQNDFIVNSSIFGMRHDYDSLINDSYSISQNFILKK